jgi:hypothetical protein
MNDKNKEDYEKSISKTGESYETWMGIDEVYC